MGSDLPTVAQILLLSLADKTFHIGRIKSILYLALFHPFNQFTKAFHKTTENSMAFGVLSIGYNNISQRIKGFRIAKKKHSYSRFKCSG